MRDEFLTRYDAATSLAAPGWEESEISNFLNIAQLRLVTELYNTGNFGLLSNLIVTDSGAGVLSSEIANAYTLDILSVHPEFLYYMGSRTQLTRTNPTVDSLTYFPNERLTDQRFAWKFHVTPFNKVWLKYPKCYTDFLEDQSSLVVLVDYYTASVGDIEVTAVVQPIMIDISTPTNTNMDLATHPTIVEYAVEEALKSIKIAKLSNQ